MRRSNWFKFILICRMIPATLYDMKNKLKLNIDEMTSLVYSNLDEFYSWL